jgi:hypothetical protein
MPTLESHNGYYLWHYIPNIGAAILFTLLFAAATGGHLWRMIKTKMWFCTPFVVGGFCSSPSPASLLLEPEDPSLTL